MADAILFEGFSSSPLHGESLFLATFWSCAKSGEKRAAAVLLRLKIDAGFGSKA
jgi:hypothetical protein